MKDVPAGAQLRAAREGSEAALAAIMARYMPLIRWCARKAAGPGLEFDDAVQEGIIGLFSAIQNYREGRGANFSTYANVCVQNAVTAAQRASRRKKHAPLNQSLPIEEAPSVPGPEDAAIASEQVRVTLQKARTVLSPLEKTVLRLYLDGFSHRQIAARLGRGEKSVENALARVRQKLR